MSKTHWYPPGSEEKQGYGKVACGQDGEVVGGLITFFFKTIRPGARCKTCNKMFKKVPSPNPG